MKNLIRTMECFENWNLMKRMKQKLNLVYKYSKRMVGVTWMGDRKASGSRGSFRTSQKSHTNKVSEFHITWHACTETSKRKTGRENEEITVSIDHLNNIFYIYTSNSSNHSELDKNK